MKKLSEEVKFERRMANRKAIAEMRTRRLADGICRDCPAKREPGNKTMCNACMKEKRLYQHRRSEGLSGRGADKYKAKPTPGLSEITRAKLKGDWKRVEMLQKGILV